MAGDGGGSWEQQQQQLQLRSSAKHGSTSIYSLTLEEIQSHLGEPGLHAMNMDELLKHVVAADACTGSSISRWSATGLGMAPHVLSKMTVAEVWRDIQPGRKGGTDHNLFGEMTLEGFLLEAGGLVAQSTGAILMDDEGRREAMADPPMRRRKRVVGTEDMAGERVVDQRRQKRMIKNRESAARSRARRRAYITDLENKVLWLEEENQRLREHKELESTVPQREPKHQLRRTSSAPF